VRQLLALPDGSRFSDHHAGDGEVMFRHACILALKAWACVAHIRASSTRALWVCMDTLVTPPAHP
jgi:hypothetical protein